MLIKNNSALEAFIQKAKRHSWIAVDTEFIREGRYWPLLCLVQLSLPDGEAIAIDTLDDAIDPAPLHDLLGDKKILKVFHASRQDLEILYLKCGSVPEPIFDTQVAAQLCGFEASLGFAALQEQCFSIKLDKGPQRAHWDRRPLPEKLLCYALNDVRYLCPLFEKIKGLLQERERADWLDDEFSSLSLPHLYDPDPSLAWRRLFLRRHSEGLSPEYLALVQELAAFREEHAQQQDVPRGYILSDNVIHSIAQNYPCSLDELKSIISLCEKKRRRYHAGAEDIFARLHKTERKLAPISPSARTMTNPMTMTMTKKSMSSKTRKEYVKKLKNILHEISKTHGIAPSFIANSHELEELALGIHQGRILQGWRHEIFGKTALSFLNY